MDDDSSQLQSFLEQVEEEGGTIDCEFDDEGKVAVLFVATYAMKQAFSTSLCTTIQVDTSFDFDAAKYKLCGFCYLSTNSNKSEFCALAFRAAETANNFRSAFQFFLAEYVLIPLPCSLWTKTSQKSQCCRKFSKQLESCYVTSMSSNMSKI